MKAQEIITEIRAIRRTIECPPLPHQRGRQGGTLKGSRRWALKALLALEKNIAPDDVDDFCSIDAPQYDTVLGFLAKNDPICLDLMNDPIHDTVIDGRTLSNMSRKRGLPVIKVAAPVHITSRYPKVTHLNAYDVTILADHFHI